MKKHLIAAGYRKGGYEEEKGTGCDTMAGLSVASGVWIVLFLGIFTRGHVLLENTVSVGFS